jgi:probable F420-dependent oxidoreductase
VTKLGLIIPTNWGQSQPNAEDYLQFCARADELGFDSLWVIDRLFHENGMPHPFVMLSYAAAATKRIGLGTGVVLLSVRHPVEVAQQAASLNALSGGRLSLGVSLGGRDNEYLASNMPKEQRAGRLVEGIDVLRRLWSEKDVTFDGRYYHLDAANIAPKPRTPIPIILGGSTPPSLARAGRIADGWMQGGRGTPQSFADAWQQVQDSAAKSGRDVSMLQSSKLFYVHPGRHEFSLGKQLETYLSFYYGPNYPMEHTAFGSTQHIVERIQSFADAGCDLMILGLPGPDIEKLELIADEVLPRFR